MQTDYKNHIDRHSHDADQEMLVESEPPISLSHFFHTLRAYKAVILLCFAATAIAAAVALILAYLLGPSQRITTLPFRLDFQGATEGKFPNGLRYSATDIISSPILLKVFAANQLDRFTSFKDFSQSVFVLESNRAYELLAADYQARLADARLTAIDRERIQREFELKRQSINKNEYSINYARTRRTDTIPETTVRKALLDILNAWANYAVNEQHVLEYPVAVLSPQVVDDAAVDPTDYIAAIQVLRAKIYRVLNNIAAIEKLPGAEQAKTGPDRTSLEEIKIRLEELVRFRLEPLVAVVRGSGLVRNMAITTRFLENQLAYDQRQLKAAQDRAEAARESLAVYAGEQRSLSGATAEASQTSKTSARAAGETVMPQLSDSFLDRLLTLTSQSADTQYRQKLVDEYRTAAKETIPFEQAVAYDQQILQEVRGSSAGGATVSAATVQTQMVGAQQQVRALIGSVNQIYQIVSRNLNPSTQLFSTAAPPTTRTERTRSLARLGLYYLLILLLALPVIIVASLIHNRVREEEAAEEYLRAEHARAT
jgi:hypothetical protein